MKVCLTLVILLASLISRPLSAEIKIYHRLGDVDQTADIYQAKDENVYVDARSLSEKVRSSITSNPEKFVKIDMRDVLSGRKVSEKGVVTYEQERFARHDSDLVEIVKLKKFLDMNTVEDPSAREKIKSAVEDFKHIGTAEKPAQEVMEAVEKRIMRDLDKIQGVLDTTTQSELGEKISKAIDTYLVNIEKQKGTVLKAFDSAIKKQQSQGNLEKMRECEALKQSYMGGTLDAEQMADKTLKATVINCSKQRFSLQESLLLSMNQEIKAQTKKGDLQAAEAIEAKKVEMISSIFTEDTTSLIQNSEGSFSHFAKQVRIVSAGFLCGNRVTIEVHKKKLIDGIGLRGISVVAVHQGKILIQKTFDTYIDPRASMEFSDEISKLPQQAFVVLAVADEATHAFSKKAQEAIVSIGGTIGLYQQPYRCSYYCIGRVGLPEGKAIERLEKIKIEYPTEN